MEFITFLIEEAKQSNAGMLILQKVIDMVDTGHVDYTDDKIVINVGKLIKDSKLYKLDIVIRKGNNHNVRLAQSNSTGNMTIVIDATRLPAREKIDTFLGKNKTVEKFVPVIQKYLKDHHDSETADQNVPVTAYEKGHLANDKKTFESKYQELEVKIKEQISDYQKSKKDLEHQISASGTPARREVLKVSLAHIKKEFLGSNEKEFISKMLKLADADFVTHLDKDSKVKLTSRLSSFYEHNS